MIVSLTSFLRLYPLHVLHVILLISHLTRYIDIVDVHILLVLVWMDAIQSERMPRLDVGVCWNWTIELIIDFVVTLDFGEVGFCSLSDLIVDHILVPVESLSDLYIPFLIPLNYPHLPISSFYLGWTSAFIPFYSSRSSLSVNRTFSDYRNSQLWAVSSSSDNLW